MVCKLGLHNPLGFTNSLEWLQDSGKQFFNYQFVTKGTSEKKSNGRDERMLAEGEKHSPYAFVCLPGIFTEAGASSCRLYGPGVSD